MPVPIVTPQLGVVEEIIVLEWLVADGATITAGQSIVMVETEKTQTELEAPVSGVLRVVIPASQDAVPIETVLGYVD